MTRPISMLALMSFAAFSSSCAVSPEAAQQAEAKSKMELAKALEGYTAGEPVSCIPNYRSTQMQVIDDDTLLYRDGRTIYVQHPVSACHGLAVGSYTLVTKQYGTNELCRGQINDMVDLRTGMRGGACVFSDFVPYTKAK